VGFTAVLAHRPSADDASALQAAHEVVGSTYGGSPRFEGVHVLASDLARHPDACPDMPTASMRGFLEADRFDLSPVSWHELAGHGITFFGSPLESLPIWSDDRVLRDLTIDNLDTYWRRRAESCAADPAGAASEVACEWVVPGVARLHHLLVTGEQTAKSLAARWGLGFYPEQWHRVLRESLWVRVGAFGAQYDDLAERGADVTAFAAYVVERGVSLRPG
jgi:aminoglycoside adenylyltransferase-like protein